MTEAEAREVYLAAERLAQEARLLVQAEKERAALIEPPSVPHGYLAARSLERTCRALLGEAAEQLSAAKGGHDGS